MFPLTRTFSGMVMSQSIPRQSACGTHDNPEAMMRALANDGHAEIAARDSSSKVKRLFQNNVQNVQALIKIHFTKSLQVGGLI